MTVLIILLLTAAAAIWLSLNAVKNDVAAIKVQLATIAERMPVNKEKLDSIAILIRGELKNLEKSHPQIFNTIPEAHRKSFILTASKIINTYRAEQRKQELAPGSRLASIEIPAYLDRLIALCDEYRDVEQS